MLKKLSRRIPNSLTELCLVITINSCFVRNSRRAVCEKGRGCLKPNEFVFSGENISFHDICEVLVNSIFYAYEIRYT